MFDFLLNEEEKALQNEVREFVKNDVPSKMVRDMGSELNGDWQAID